MFWLNESTQDTLCACVWPGILTLFAIIKIWLGGYDGTTLNTHINDEVDEYRQPYPYDEGEFSYWPLIQYATRMGYFSTSTVQMLIYRQIYLVHCNIEVEE